MGLISKMFGKQINQAIEQKAQELVYNGQEQYFRSIYGQMLSGGFMLKSDSQISNYVSQGFEGNPDIYSLLMRCATQGSQVEWEVKKKDIIEEDPNHPLNKFVKTPNSYQTFTEFTQVWQIFHLLTGNGLIYYPTFKEGNNKGALMTNVGAFNLPSQDVQIKSGGFLKPIVSYVIETNILPENELPIEDVIHTRMPNLDYSMGNNLMGMSPLKVAANIVTMQNLGISRMSEIYKTGIPPAILTKIFQDENLNASKASAAELEDFKKNWKSKSKSGMPFYGFGKHEYIKLGTDIIKDLDMINTIPMGFRILCNLWGLPSQLFNDVAGTTFNNMEQAVKSMWTNRLIPDYYMLAEKINQKIQVTYPDYSIWPKFDKVAELQPDRQRLATIYGDLYAKGLYTVNEVRGKMDDEEIKTPFGDSFFGVMGNKIDPMDNSIEDEVNKGEQFLDKNNINDYKK